MADLDPRDVKQLTDAYHRQEAQLKDVASAAQELARRLGSLGNTKGVEKSRKAFSQYSEEVKGLRDTYMKNVRALVSSNKRTAAQYKSLGKFVSKYRDELSKPIKIVLDFEHKRKRVRQEARREAAEYLGGRARGAIGGAAGALGLGSRTMSGAANAFADTWQQGQKMKSSFTELVSIMKIAGNGTNIFVGGLKLLGEVIKGNPILLLVSGLKAAFSVVNELDQMIKGLNRNWREMAGSPVLIGNVRKSMKAFNDSLFNIGRNMRLGLKAADISDFFKTMSSAGLSTEGVAKRVGDFNDAIETGFKLSRQFGVSFSDMGQMMADQMLNLRSSLDDVSDAFKTMSYDAAVAGVQSQKFYQIVESASMSLSFYGNFLKSTSSMLRTFTETGIMGFKDASQTVQDLMGTIKGMSTTQRLAAINVIGQDKVYAMFQDRLKSMGDDIADYQKKVNEAEAVLAQAAGGAAQDVAKKELDAAKKRLAAAKLDRSVLKQRVGEGDLVGMASMMESLSDKVMEMAADYLKNLNVDPFENVLATQTLLQQGFNMTADMSNRVMKKSIGVLDMFQQKYENFTGALKDGDKKANLDNLSDRLTKFFTDPKSPFLSMESMLDYARGELTAIGIGGKEAEDLLQVMGESGPYFKEYMEALAMPTETLKQQAARMEKFKEIALKAGTVVAPGKEAEMKDRQLEELVKQTTPIADYLEIGKEGIKYALASSDIQNTIALGVTATAKFAGKLLSNVIAWFKLDKGGQLSPLEKELVGKGPEEGKKGREYEALLEKKRLLADMYEIKKQKGARPEELRNLELMREKVTAEIEEFEDAFATVPYALEEVRVKAEEVYSEQYDRLMKNMRIMDDGRKKLDTYDEALKDTNLNEQDRADMQENYRLVNNEVTAAVSDYNQALERLSPAVNSTTGSVAEMVKLLGEVAPSVRKAEKNIGTSVYTGATVQQATGVQNEPVTRQTERELTPGEKNKLLRFMGTPEYEKLMQEGGYAAVLKNLGINQKQDFLAQSGGFVKIKKGDYIIDSSSLAEGMGMGKGQLMNYGAGIMKGGNGGVSIGNISLNFNAPLNGSPEEYRRVFLEAVNDVVSQRLYEQKERVK